MSQSLSRRSFLKCAGSGAVSLAAALLTGVSAAAAQPRVMGQPALLDGKAAVELLGYAPAPGLGGVLVYLSVENLSARTLPVGASYLHSRDVSTLKELYSLDSGVTARCGGQSVPCGSFAAPLYAENAADASAFTLRRAAATKARSASAFIIMMRLKIRLRKRHLLQVRNRLPSQKMSLVRWYIIIRVLPFCTFLQTELYIGSI